MKKTLLALAALGMAATPGAAAERSLRIEVTMTGQSIARATIGTKSFLLPDEQEAMIAALKTMRLKRRSVTIAAGGDVPYRVCGGLIYRMQSAGFRKLAFITEPPPN